MNSFTIETDNGYAVFNGISLINKHVMSYYNFSFLTSKATEALKRTDDDKKSIYTPTITNLSVDKNLGIVPLDDTNTEQLYKLYNAITFSLDEISKELAEDLLSKSSKSSAYIDYIIKLYNLTNSEDISITAYNEIKNKINVIKQLFEANTLVCSLESFNSYSGIIAPASISYSYKPSLDYGTLQGIILYES